MPLPSLSEWDSFWVITGSSAGALTGLMFVVITLGAESRGVRSEEGVRAFGSPVLVRFCQVLFLSAFMSIPGHTATSLALVLGACGVGGLALAAWVVVQGRRQTAYQPVLSDWIWHVVLPLLAYLWLIAAALLLPVRPMAALDLTAAVALFLLFLGIRNAWDSAVWMAVHRR